LIAAKIDQTPRHAAAVPFASESGLQRFVEENAEAVLGVNVLASSRRDGNCLFRIDTLAEDQDGRPWIIECKHDLVDAGALAQLRRYRDALIAGWPTVASRFRNGTNRDQPDPLLVAIGYRFDDSFADAQALRLVYRYHDVAFTGGDLQSQNAGRVSLQSADEVVSSPQVHPKVSKKFATIERLQHLPLALEEAFWRIDAALRAMPGVRVKYGGKNFVRYGTNAGVFAEAVIGEGVIEWRASMLRLMRSDADAEEILTVLQQARGGGPATM
jgi:hypothetical protein